ncbi:DUF6538 domain-containing protein [Xanthobacter variabilis]|uniref:DUF6538 domain-containing protein n=1 Tax=Xanthobacter variabilis TaxID=3119932 RepID=UPI00374F3C3F
MPRPTHRHGSSNLTFRKRIPADLRGRVTGQSVLIHFPAHGHEPECTVAATLGASEVTFSLRTRDPQTAKARTGIAEDHLQRLFVSLRTGPTRLSQKQAVALAGAWYRGFVARLEDNPGKSLVFEKLQQAVGERLDDSSALRAEMAPFVDDLLSARALVVDDDSRELLATAMRGAIRDAAGTLLRRAEGDYGPDAVVQRFPSEAALPRPEIGGAAKTPSTGKGVTLTGLAEAWGRERQPRAKTLEEHLRVVKAFVAFVKHDDATAITPEDVVGWKDALVAEGRLAAKTINAKYLTPLGTVLNWGKANRKITSNPAQGIRSSGKAPPRTRDRSFTHEEATTILKAALHAYDAPGRNAPEMLAARRWVPWLCAYSGARVSEITQLRGQDFQEVNGVWVLRISPEAGAVKTDKPRMVPVHPDLIRQGLLEFVKERGDGPLFYKEAPSHQKGPAKAHPAKTIAGRLAGWVRDIGVNDPHVQPNHGWRHLFMTLCREHQVAEEARYFIVGHTLRDTGQRYGEASAAALAGELSKLPAFEVEE